jgi:hypothetical protein
MEVVIGIAAFVVIVMCLGFIFGDPVDEQKTALAN